MLAHTTRNDQKLDIDYWRTRVLSLETLICELLIKNQRMSSSRTAVISSSSTLAVTPAFSRSIRVVLNEQGSVLVTLPVRQSSRMMPELVQEHVQEQISSAVAYATWVLERIDPTQRITHVALAVTLSNAEHMGWRTQRESDASPNRISVSASGSGQRSPVEVSRTRSALRLDTTRIVEDLLVPLRRQWR